MKADVSIPKELLAQIDYQNTFNGGTTQSEISAWKEEQGYRLMLKATGINPEKLQIQTANQRFLIYYMVDVLEGTEQVPHYLVNLPLSPEVDVDKIKAQFEHNGYVSIYAPFNDWAKGSNRHIDIDF